MNHPYLPLTDRQRQEMLQKTGVQSFEELIADIPSEIRLEHPLNLPGSLTEVELRAAFSAFAGRNQLPELSFLGAGAYHHYIPAVVNHLANRSEFYTAYTPYQPEISQGILQAIFEYQTFIAELFGLPIANASLYDGPTALAEAVLMTVRESRESRVLIPETLSPYLTQVLKTYTKNLGITMITIPEEHGLMNPGQLEAELQLRAAAVIIQNPNFFGLVENVPELLKIIKAHDTVSICYVHPLTMGILESPGHLGAEIVVGEGQPLGLPVSFGGPYLGLMAVSERFLRRIPGRLVGESVDHQGKRAYVLTLQTREQHIRREKATSNICSNETYCALRAAIYLAAIGPEGVKNIARRSFNNAHYLYFQLETLGLKPLFNSPFLMEFAVNTPKPAIFYIDQLLAKGILAGFDLSQTHPGLGNALLICVTEIFSKDQLDRFVAEMRSLL